MSHITQYTLIFFVKKNSFCTNFECLLYNAKWSLHIYCVLIYRLLNLQANWCPPHLQFKSRNNQMYFFFTSVSTLHNSTDVKTGFPVYMLTVNRPFLPGMVQ